MEKNNQVAWYVTIYSNGLKRTYNFKTDTDRDSVYDFLIDRILRNQHISIEDCDIGEKYLIKPNSTVIKGKLILEEEFEEISNTKFCDKNRLILSAMGNRL